VTSIVILNGPAGSGKDSAATYLAGHGFVHLEFKKKLFELTKSIYCISDKDWDKLYTRQNKETPSELLNGLSPRQALIKVSEEGIKPNFGKEYFGIAAAKSVRPNQMNVFSDGGFAEELKPLITMYGPENILILQIYREGCSFAGDSRNYVSHPDISLGVVYNNSTEEDFWLDVYNKIGLWAGRKYHANRH
jgi:hypothetical protein